MEAIDSAIKVLEAIEKNYQETQKKLHKFKFKRELHQSAREMQLHLERTKGISAQHVQLKLRERIKRYMKESGKFAEALCLGYITPINILINIFINDGMKSKAFRKNLLHSKFSHIGNFKDSCI